jgi:hypothetical protein
MWDWAPDDAHLDTGRVHNAAHRQCPTQVKDFTAEKHYFMGSGDLLIFSSTLLRVCRKLCMLGPPMQRQFHEFEFEQLSYLRGFWIPEQGRSTGSEPQLRAYITNSELDMMYSVGLSTVRDLAHAEKYQILKLRGSGREVLFLQPIQTHVLRR